MGRDGLGWTGLGWDGQGWARMGTACGCDHLFLAIEAEADAMDGAVAGSHLLT